MNYSEMETREIVSLISELNQILRQRTKQEKSNLVQEMRIKASSLNIPWEDVIKEMKSKKNKAKTMSAPKYQNPNDPLQTWVGKGRKPEWLVKLLAEGKSMDDMKI